MPTLKLKVAETDGSEGQSDPYIYSESAARYPTGETPTHTVKHHAQRLYDVHLAEAVSRQAEQYLGGSA